MPRKKVRSRPRSRRRPSPWQGTLRLGMVFVALVGVNVYFFFLRGGTSLRELVRTSRMRAAATQGVVAAPSSPQRPEPARRTRPLAEATGQREPGGEFDEPRVLEGVLKDTDTIERVWRKEGLPARSVSELVGALGKVFDLRMERGGHRWQLRLDGAERVQSAEYRVSPRLAYRVERRGAAYVAWRDERVLDRRVVEVAGVVQTGLVDAVHRAGEQPALVVMLAEALGGELDGLSDVAPGDSFRLLVEKQLLDGKFVSYGRLLAAEYRGRAGRVRVFWFEPSGPGSGGYYTEHGESATRVMLRSPLKFQPVVSSSDRRRLRPTLHAERALLGGDYPAPQGAPVWATAQGRVTFIGSRAAQGITIVVTHPGGTETLYSHLGRVAPRLAVGTPVRQGQVIGLVGAGPKGQSPHVHYAVKLDGLFVDPLRLRPARDGSLPAQHRVAFADAIAPRLNALAAIEPRLPASIARAGL